MAHDRNQPVDDAALPREGGCCVVERVEYAPADLLMRVSLRTCVAPSSGQAPVLVAARGEVELCYTPIVWSSTVGDPALAADAAEWRLHAAYSVPADVAGDRGCELALRLDSGLMLPLPPAAHAPRDRGVARRAGRRGRSRMKRLRRGPIALVLGVALLFTPAVGPMHPLAAAAIADGTSEGTPEVTPPPAETPAETTPAPPPAKEEETTVPTTTPEPKTPPPVEEPAHEEGKHQAPPPVGPTGETTTPAPEAPTPRTTPSTPAAPEPVASAPTSVRTAISAPAPRGGTSSLREEHVRGTRHAAAGSAHAAHGHNAPQPQKAQAEDEPQPGALSVEAGVLAPELAELTGLLGGVEEGPPAYLVPIYKAAGHRYHVPWRVLAAINAIETDYGRNLSVSSAGAEGWMQFMPETWALWGVDADRDGVKNPYSPQDAIFAAARYLQASGAEHDLAGAIFAYNHAAWYVSEVLLRAHLLANAASFARVEDGYSLPLARRYMRTLGRTDDGVDIETPPDGALVYSITPGVVTAVASDPSGFGPNYPVVRATAGSLQGRSIYYGHVAVALVHPGDVVAAGQPIALIGHTGDAVSLGHGHIEIGFSDEGGDPLSHHGAGAWTPAGDIMRAFLVGLSSSFGIQNE